MIGLLGNSGAGKDTVCSLICQEIDAVRIGLADPMKEMFQKLYGWSDEQLWGSSESRNGEDEWLGFSPRSVLIELGMLARKWHEDTWIDYALVEARRRGKSAVFSDLRFKNDCQGVLAAGGEVWNIIRPDVKPVPTEISDCATHTLLNNCSLEQLQKRVQGTLTSFDLRVTV